MITDNGRRVRKSPSLHGRKSTPNPNFLVTSRSISFLPHRPKFSYFFDLYLHWVSVVRDHDYLTRTSSDNPQTPLYYHLIEKCTIPFAFIDHKNDDNLLCYRLDKMLAKQWLFFFLLNVLLLNAFIYEFTTSLGAHI